MKQEMTASEFRKQTAVGIIYTFVVVPLGIATFVRSLMRLLK